MQVATVRIQACLDISEALTSRELREGERVEVTSATEVADPLVTTVFVDNVPE